MYKCKSMGYKYGFNVVLLKGKSGSTMMSYGEL